MKNQWYADIRDLIKWGGIVHLCETTQIKYVIQVAYLTDSPRLWSPLNFDGKDVPIPGHVITHFRSIGDIKRLGKKAGITIDVVKAEFSRSDRKAYGEAICKRIEKQPQRKIVLLDPDTGLAVKNAQEKHVKPEEVLLIWQALKPRDFLVLYQHKPRKSEWKNVRRKELAKALSVKENTIRMWEAMEKVRDVVFFFCKK